MPAEKSRGKIARGTEPSTPMGTAGSSSRPLRHVGRPTPGSMVFSKTDATTDQHLEEQRRWQVTQGYNFGRDRGNSPTTNARTRNTLSIILRLGFWGRKMSSAVVG